LTGPQGERGEKGERGDVLFIANPTNEQVAAALAEIQLTKARIHAAFISGILQHEKDRDPRIRQHFEKLLAQIKRDAGIP